MRKIFIRLLKLILPIIAFFSLACQNQQEAAKTTKPAKSGIYNSQADAQQDLQAAIKKASLENKNILLMFGANWCPWCHRLHAQFVKNKAIKAELDSNFLLVMIDLGRHDKNMDLDSLYGHPNKLGLPALVVLDKTGKQIHIQETGAFELPAEKGKGHDPEKILTFLREWKPTNL